MTAPFTVSQTFAIGPDCPVNVAGFAMSTHCGAHVDAPLHYDPKGASSDVLDLSDFIGPARVIDARGTGPLCCYAADPGCARRRTAKAALQTDGQGRFIGTAWGGFPGDGARKTGKRLALRGTRLMGVDVPSVDPETSKDLPSHMVSKRHDIRIMESLLLTDVAPGDYELIAGAAAVACGGLTRLRCAPCSGNDGQIDVANPGGFPLCSGRSGVI